MTDDLPSDVQETLSQLFAEGRDALAADDIETGRAAVTSAESVVTNKLPEGDRRSQLLHGCERVSRLLDSDEVDTAVATEYVAAMARRVSSGEE